MFKHSLISLAVICLAFLVSCNQNVRHKQDSSKLLEKQIVALIDVWHTRDFDQLDSIFTPDGVYEDVPDNAEYHGREDIKKYIRDVTDWAPDTKVEIVPSSLFVSGNKGSVQWVWSGTSTGNLGDLVLAAGNQFKVRGVSTFEFENGLIKRNSDYYDGAGFLHQLGVKFVFPEANK
jgi:steroid delta-isomerase-like uncharacterized protein